MLGIIQLRQALYSVAAISKSRGRIAAGGGRAYSGESCCGTQRGRDRREPVTLKRMKIELVVFDLDGTLVDSKMALAQAVNATRADAGLPPLPDDTVFAYVGNGAPTLVRRALGEGFDDQQVARSLQFFLDYSRTHML